MFVFLAGGTAAPQHIQASRSCVPIGLTICFFLHNFLAIFQILKQSLHSILFLSFVPWILRAY